MKVTGKGIALAVIFSISLAAIYTFAPGAAYAAVSGIDALPGSESPQEAVLEEGGRHLRGEAAVKAPLEGNQLHVTVNGMDVVLNISDETLLLDSKTGMKASLHDLKANDTLYVYYSAAMTKSLPPQSNAIAVITQVEKNKGHAELFTVREIISREKGEVRALNKEGDLIVTFHQEAPLNPYGTKRLVSTDDIQVGSRLFIWYEIVAMSYPGQTGATRAVWIGQEEGNGVRAVYTPMAGADAVTVIVQGKPLPLEGKHLVSRNGLLMVPLRTAAESLGFSVVWNGSDRSINLDNGTVKTTLVIGEDSYYKASSQAIGLTQSFSLGAEPTIIDGHTYIPAALFNLLYSDNSAVKTELK